MMNNTQDTTANLGDVNPLFQAVEWHGQMYYTTRYFHQEYLLHMAENGRKLKHKRHDNFFRVIQSMPIYHLLVQQGDIVELQWDHVKMTVPHKLRKVFEAVRFNRLVLLNAVAQAELTHHLDDPHSQAIAYGQNRQVAIQASQEPHPKALDAYPELRAIIELVEGVAEARHAAEVAHLEAEAAQRDARDATEKANLALQQQQWLTIREYVYLNKLTHQFPESLWSTFGRYLTGYCLEHNIPIRRQPIAGKGYDMEHAYHVEIMEQLVSHWLKRQQNQFHLHQVK